MYVYWRALRHLYLFACVTPRASGGRFTPRIGGLGVQWNELHVRRIAVGASSALMPIFWLPRPLRFCCACVCFHQWCVVLCARAFVSCVSCVSCVCVCVHTPLRHRRSSMDRYFSNMSRTPPYALLSVVLHAVCVS